MINIAKEYLGVGFKGKLEIMDYYNKHCFPMVAANRRYRIQPNDDWCAAFVSVVAHRAGLAGDEFPFEVSCYYMEKSARTLGLDAVGVDVVTNDIVLFDWDGNGVPDHVGLVSGVTGGLITTIEGNYKGTVGYRTIETDSYLIKSIYRSKYQRPTSENEAGRIDYLARAVIRGNYGHGMQRRILLGSDYDAVQARVNTLLKNEHK